MTNLDIDYYNHPVFQPQELKLKTLAMKKISEEIHRWLWTGATGGLITGASRVGKTTALLALTSELRTRGKTPIPVYYISIPQRDQRTILSVFRQLCWSVDLRVTQRDRADHLSDRYVHYIADRAVEKDSRTAVLIVDEMQHLYPTQFNPFAELYDKLLLLGITLMVIFVGNDQECCKLIEQIQKPQYAHIHGRFFTQGISFLGLTSKNQVQRCLRQYDKLRYPINGPTYTGYFLAEAVGKGWGFESLAEDTWQIFRSYQKTYHIESWGMQYFTATVNTLLTDFLPRYGVEHFEEDMVHECIRISGLIPSLIRPVS